MTDPIRSALKRLLSAVLDGLGQDDHPMGWARVDDAIDAARAALAEPAPPAEVEVGEWVEFLRIYGDEVMDEYGDVGEHDQLTRAADLLERQAAPVPVAVGERLPGPGDCDAEGFCWWFSPADPAAGTFGVAACWVLRKYEPEDDFRTHWLPAHALPLPAGEVQ